MDEKRSGGAHEKRTSVAMDEKRSSGAIDKKRTHWVGTAVLKV
jgi:hypothetical protein